MWSAAEEAAAILLFLPKSQTASALRPALGPFLIFDHLASAVERRG